jgi:hypothetical protein
MEHSLSLLQAEIDQVRIQNLHARGVLRCLLEAEFKVFSQFGDDGIIQYLIHHLRPLPDSFVEFGVQNYRESNTRFLLVNNNWRGLVMDGDAEFIRFIQKDDIYWRHPLTARCAFIDRDNVNNLFSDAGFTGEIGLLSIDIDGNDYWVWEKLEVVDPVIVIVEYNSIFGPDFAVTIPYDPKFVRHQAHYAGQFWGVSLQALTLLAGRKGDSLVGCNSAGNNAYFVRNNKLGELPAFSAREAFVESRFRDSRSRSGELTYLSGSQRFDEISRLELYDVERKIQVTLDSLKRK